MVCVKQWFMTARSHYNPYIINKENNALKSITLKYTTVIVLSLFVTIKLNNKRSFKMNPVSYKMWETV